MTDSFWPNDFEWDLWFQNKKEEACRFYRRTLYHWYSDESSRPPSRKEVEKIFQDCVETTYRGLKPYSRFLRRRTQKICQVLEANKKYLGHW